VNEIGGNKFLLEDRGTRVFLDFGKNYAREKRFFDEPWISPRKEEHLIGLGILPDLDGLYRSDVEHEASVDAVLISHPHTDHYDAVRWLKKDIPTYMTATARTMVLSREFSGRPAPSSDYYIANWTRRNGQVIHRPLDIVVPGKQQDVAGLPTTAFQVDHSVHGAVGYVVETSAGSVAYTGDFRLHGPRADMTRAFLQAAAEREPAALIIEGTHVDECKVESEEEVEQKVASVVQRTKGLVAAGFAFADVDRLTTFHRVARQTDRQLVMTEKQAFLVDQLCQEGLFDSFDLRSGDVGILRKEKRTSGAWEEHLFDVYGGRVVEASDVAEDQEGTILVASLMDMLALPTIDPMPGSVYILSSSEPFDEEMEISFEKLKGWLTHYGLPMFQVHASGHASAHDLLEAVEAVRPRRVFLVHTSNAALYARYLDRLGFDVVQPEEGREYGL
jgi:ribonuclease J